MLHSHQLDFVADSSHFLRHVSWLQQWKAHVLAEPVRDQLLGRAAMGSHHVAKAELALDAFEHGLGEMEAEIKCTLINKGCRILLLHFLLLEMVDKTKAPVYRLHILLHK